MKAFSLRHWQIGLATGILLACLLPAWAAWWQNDLFVFVNGWDEETYLSWQGVLGARNQIGYFPLHVYGWLHTLGLSGALQNLLSDTLFPLASVALVSATLCRFGIESTRAFTYAVLILFSSTLFNYTNPIIKALLGDYNATAWIMAGWELYPSIMRTPNPQVSYFLLALTVYAWARWRRDWLLLLPLPLLYYFVAVPYCFLLGFGMLIRMMRRYNIAGTLPWLAGTGLLVWVIMGLGTAALFWIAGYYAPDYWERQDAWLFAVTRQPQIPLALLGLGAVTALATAVRAIDTQARAWQLVLILTIAALASVNLHVITGFMLSQKNYYDYGLSILFGMMLVVGLESLRNHKLADWLLSFLLFATLLPTLATQLYFYQHATDIDRRASPIAAQVVADPLHALIADRDVASHMAFAHAHLLAPPFTYQYYFTFIEHQCAYYPELLETAVREAESEWAPGGPEHTMLNETLDHIHKRQQIARSIPYHNQPYCTPEAYSPQGFRILRTQP